MSSRWPEPEVQPPSPPPANAALCSLLPELELGLQRLRSALEAHAENRDEDALLDAAAAELAQLRGTLALLRIDGGERIAAEMLALLEPLRNGSVPYDDAALALGCASLRCSGYLDLLADGEDDNALLLVATLNELRQARRATPLTEAELVVARANAGHWSASLPDDGGLIAPQLLDVDSARSLARRELGTFQSAFLQWFRGIDAPTALATMSQITDRVAGAVGDHGLRTLWLAHALLADALRRGLDAPVSLELKRLVGRAGVQLKALADHGEVTAAAQAGDTVWWLLHALSCEETPSERVRLLFARLALAERLPSPAHLAVLHHRLAGPGRAISRQMQAEIRREFARIKDSLDLAVRTHGQPGKPIVTWLAPTLLRLRLLASSLATLGLPTLQTALLAQATELDEATAADSQTPPDWLALAIALLRIELSLDDHLLRSPNRQQALVDNTTPARHEQDDASEALHRELLADCGRIRAEVEHGLRDGEASAAQPALAGLLHGIAAALAIAGETQAAQQVGRIERQALVQQPADATGALLIESLAALEAWIEAARSGRDRRTLAAGLHRAVDRLAVQTSLAVTTGAPPAASFDQPVDPELRGVFIDEAQEMLSTLEASLPAFRRDPSQRDGLATIRRAFHTLKGSSRTVGAEAIGDLGWAVEKLLNHCADGERAADAALITLIDDAVSVLRGLIACFRDGAAVAPAVAELIGRAGRLASGRNDGDVRSLFGDDAREQLGVLRLWLEADGDSSAELPIPADAVRALHTLRGSAAVVNAVAISRLAAQLEAVLEGLRLREQRLPARARPLLLEALLSLRDWIAAHGSDHQARDEAADAWAARLATLDEPAPAAAPVVDGAFALAALETLRSIDGQLRRWRPDSNSGPDSAAAGLVESLQQLVRLATDAGVAELATMAAALAERLQAWIGGPFAPPDATLFTTLQAQVEGLFRRLDQYRDGADNGAAVDVAAWLAGTAALPEPEPEPEPETAPSIATSAVTDEIDPELRNIFLGEGQELLEEMAITAGLWSGAADDTATLAALRRTLHTLKGSARMAGAAALGEVAHRIESMLERPAGHGAPALLAAFEAGLDGLQRQLDRLRDGQILPAEAVLSAIASALGISDSPVSAQPPSASPTPAPEQPQLPDTPDPAWLPTVPPGERHTDSVRDAPQPVPPPALTEAPVSGPQTWSPELFWKPDDEIGAQPALRRESARVPVELLDAMLGQAGETAIVRSRLEEQHALLKNQLGEIAQTVARIRDQLRLMDIETEAQIAARGRGDPATANEDHYASEFDALELDRYSRMQELSRALAEAVGDLGSLHGSMDEAVASADQLLLQQGHITTELQQGLMSTLMVPFARQMQRLLRVVRQTAQENGKEADLSFAGADAELDRNVLERMTAPLEHLLRNAVVHGIEAPERRRTAGKPPGGIIRITLAREGAQLLVEVSDDGAGLDYAAIRRKAVERGLIGDATELSDEALGRFILEAGFSTAQHLTQDAGRGIGMDVVANQVRQLGGTLELRSEAGVGTRFLIRLPLTLAVSQALLVGVGPETYALPLTTIEGVGRIARKDLDAYLVADGPLFDFDGRGYRLRHLGDYVGLPRGEAPDGKSAGVILVHLGDVLAIGRERRLALVVDRLLGNREIVTKSAGPQLSSIAGISGATILADGSVAMILDLSTLIADRDRRALLVGAAQPVERRAAEVDATVLVVDDSITMRRVAERVLQRQGYKVLTAKDGLDAMALLQTERPSAVLLDIEMPRADGFEVAAFIRNSERLAGLPIIMITSRSGEKHRARARQLGVDRYLTKPYQEEQLLAEVRQLLWNRP